MVQKKISKRVLNVSIRNSKRKIQKAKQTMGKLLLRGTSVTIKDMQNVH